MKSSRVFGTRRLLAVAALLFGGMVTSAFAQQEVDPTWFNPWVAPAASVQTAQAAPVAKTKAIAQKNQKRVKSVLSTQHTAKKHAAAQSTAS